MAVTRLFGRVVVARGVVGSAGSHGRRVGGAFRWPGRLHWLRRGRRLGSFGSHGLLPKSKGAIILYRMMAPGSTLGPPAGYIIHPSSAG